MSSSKSKGPGNPGPFDLDLSIQVFFSVSVHQIGGFWQFPIFFWQSDPRILLVYEDINGSYKKGEYDVLQIFLLDS